MLFRLNGVQLRNTFIQTELRTAKSKKKNVIFGQYQTKMVTVDMGRPGKGYVLSKIVNIQTIACATKFREL